MARLVGVHHSTIQGYVNDGFVSRGKDKKFDVAEVLAYRESIDPSRQRLGDLSRIAAGGEAQQPLTGDDLDDEAEEGSISRSKKRLEHWKAERAELQAKKEAGDLVSRAAVETAIGAIGSAVQLSAMNFAPKLRPHLTDAGKDILEKEIEAMLTDMVKQLRGLMLT